MGTERLANTQAAGLIWSDLLAPAWNRKQERAADQNGFELMRAAGYDPSAFGALFEKLHAAAGKRSQRMELLKKAMLAKAHAQAGNPQPPSPSTDQIAQDMKSHADRRGRRRHHHGTCQLQSGLRFAGGAAEAAGQLCARASPEKALDVKPTHRFKRVLKQGSGARLLAADAAAMRTLNALAERDMAAADKKVGRGPDARPALRTSPRLI